MIPSEPDSERSSSRFLVARRLPKHPLWFRLMLYFIFGVSLLNWFVINRAFTML